MSLPEQQEEALPFEEIPEPEYLANLKEQVKANPYPTILCETKDHNPNYLASIFANQRFYEVFDLQDFSIIGKNYDFLFDNFDYEDSSEDNLEHIRLIKMVKDFQACAVVINIRTQKIESKFRITFHPLEFKVDDNHRFATISFEELTIGTAEYNQTNSKKSQSTLLRSLERTLRHERLLREIGLLIMSDTPIAEVAQKIAKILCEYLKADRCILHDYQDAGTSFVVEHCAFDAKPILDDQDNLTHYINFQNQFFKKFGYRNKNNTPIAVTDTFCDINFTTIEPILKKFAVTSQMVVTTTFADKINGGIYVHQSDRRNWLLDEIELLGMVSGQFSIAIERANSIDKVMIANHNLIENSIKLKEALRREQEMRKMQNEFVALVSHEFKTPLQIIDSTREVLLRKVKNLNINDESITSSLERIKAGIQRMSGLINSTLNLAKMESGDGKIRLDKEIFDLKEFILGIIKKNKVLALNKNLTIITKLNELPADFYGDPRLLDHSISNIITNAIKYSKNDSIVKIIAKTSKDKIGIRVIDKGIGIPKEDLKNIGQKFFRAKNSLAVAGTGIGIYLARHFVELHGGTITIDSEIKVGTSITVILPRIQDTAS